MSEDAPIIEGTELPQAKEGRTRASAIMLDPATAAQVAQKPETYRPTTIPELLADIPRRTSNPTLAQVFMLNALQEFSGAVSKAQPSDIAEFDALMEAQGGGPDGHEWHEIGKQINHIITEHVAFANSQAGEQPKEEPMLDKRQEIDGYIQALTAHDWSKPIPPELQELKDRLDPTGEIMEGHKPRITH